MGEVAAMQAQLSKSKCLVGQRQTRTEGLMQKVLKTTGKYQFSETKRTRKSFHELMNKPKSGDTLQQIGKIQQELGTIHNKWVLGAKIRSKEKFYHDDEKPTKYFFNLENHRQSQKSISELVDEQGVRHTTHKELMKHMADFYEDLYTFEPTNAKAQETLLNTIHRHLPEEVRAGLKGPLTLDGCYQAMGGMERRKSPGSDSLPVEFYFLFWEIIGEDLVDILNHTRVFHH